MPDLGYLNFPPLVEQVDEMSCWAAALEAWLSVTPGRKRRTQHELIGVMEQKAALDAEGYLNIKKGVPLLAQMVGMGLEVFPKHKKAQLTGTYLLKKLAKRGYLYMVYNVYGIGHAVVVYGIVNEPGNETIFAMDPWRGRYTNDTLADYKQDSHEFVVGWPAY